MPFPTQLDNSLHDEYLARLLAQAARANAAMPGIIAEMRASGALKTVRKPEQSAIQKDYDEEREGGWAV